MALQRFIDGKRVLHTRKLSDDRIEVTFPPATPGGPRVREVMAFDVYQKKASREEAAAAAPAAG